VGLSAEAFGSADDEGEYGFEEGVRHSADESAEDEDECGLEESDECVAGAFYFSVVEGGDFGEHAGEVSAFFADGDHADEEGGEDGGVFFEGGFEVAALFDVLFDLLEALFDVGVVGAADAEFDGGDEGAAAFDGGGQGVG
jgi:hypothetical protein